MTGVNITLSNSVIKSKEFDHIPMFLVTSVNNQAFSILCDLSIGGYEKQVMEASNIAKSLMYCEIDQLKDELRMEVKKARKLLKKKFPIRYRFELVKKLLSKPFAAMYGFILLKKRKYK
jgi:hypothetical protein